MQHWWGAWKSGLPDTHTSLVAYHRRSRSVAHDTARQFGSCMMADGGAHGSAGGDVLVK
jgi:hypothetical protein